MIAKTKQEKNTDDTILKYIITCRTCKKSFRSPNTVSRNCSKCKEKNIPKKYPRMFYYNKRLVYARDCFICQLCGADFHHVTTECLPHVHHIDGNKKNNNLTNLVTLCSQCHIKVHTQFTKEQLKTYNFHQLFKIKHYVEIKKEKQETKEKPFFFKNI